MALFFFFLLYRFERSLVVSDEGARQRRHIGHCRPVTGPSSTTAESGADAARCARRARGRVHSWTEHLATVYNNSRRRLCMCGLFQDTRIWPEDRYLEIIHWIVNRFFVVCFQRRELHPSVSPIQKVHVEFGRIFQIERTLDNKYTKTKEFKKSLSTFVFVQIIRFKILIL